MVEKPLSFAVDDESFLVIPGALDVSKKEPPCSDSSSRPGPAGRIFNAKFAASGNAFEQRVVKFEMAWEKFRSLRGRLGLFGGMIHCYADPWNVQISSW